MTTTAAPPTPRRCTRVAHATRGARRDARATASPRIVGIHSGGTWIGERLHRDLGLPGAPGALDISFYRDDFNRIGLHGQVKPTDIDFDVDGADILLVDDVLYSGRTLRGALNVLFDFGRPARVDLAVLIDRETPERRRARDADRRALGRRRLTLPRDREFVLSQDDGGASRSRSRDTPRRSATGADDAQPAAQPRRRAASPAVDRGAAARADHAHPRHGGRLRRDSSIRVARSRSCRCCAAAACSTCSSRTRPARGPRSRSRRRDCRPTSSTSTSRRRRPTRASRCSTRSTTCRRCTPTSSSCATRRAARRT